MNVETANRLVQLRKKRGYSQEELAEKLGLSRQAVSKWERAEASPDTDNLIALSKLYGITLDELVTGCSSGKEANEEQADKTGSGEKKKEYVYIGLGGVHVENEKDSVHISFKDGIHVESENDSVHMNPGDKKINVNGELKDIGHYKKKGAKRAAFSGILASVAVAAFIALGVLFNAWHPAWLIFFLVPVIESLYSAIEKRSANAFAYPLLMTAAFLAVGFCCGLWHPAWVLFLTIPVYYGIANICKKSKQNGE